MPPPVMATIHHLAASLEYQTVVDIPFLIESQQALALNLSSSNSTKYLHKTDKNWHDIQRQVVKDKKNTTQASSKFLLSNQKKGASLTAYSPISKAIHIQPLDQSLPGSSKQLLTSKIAEPTTTLITQATSSAVVKVPGQQPYQKSNKQSVEFQVIAQVANSQITNLSETLTNEIPAVSKLSDVQSTDWKLQALQLLMERYGVTVLCDNDIFQGNRSVTRFEFAICLNGLLNYIQAQINTDQMKVIDQEDTIVLQRLQQEFTNELAVLQGHIDLLEARTAALETQQFATTTKLTGEVKFNLIDGWGGRVTGKGDSNPVLTYLTKLQFNTSFSGKDLLFIELAAGNAVNRNFADSDSFGTKMALWSEAGNTNNQTFLTVLQYRFTAFNDRITFKITPVGHRTYIVLNSNSSTEGLALSQFGEFSPVFRIGLEELNTGLGIDWSITDQTQLQFVYSAKNANDPNSGLFNSDSYAIGTQLLVRPTENFTTGIAYIHAQSEDGSLNTLAGSLNADTSGGFKERAQIQAINGTLQWRLLPNVTLGAWGGYIRTKSRESDAEANSTTYAVSLLVRDLFGREGDTLGVIFGQPLKLINGKLIQREDVSTSLHYELFYDFRVNNNISITPGFFVITNPEHNSGNNTIIIGGIRTRFRF
ncbi:iron uptake porin (plasmid) [Nostoc edaphicum CCNP1411]|uniref:Iron uptake porin n=1 Tax=Nostoc edaphicum CCNP1411 TaxID=1472755 RepID=A0A7D7QHH0_9NOSO|nr:iron uptake porin [Nostoc edaphicum]QMS86244.1 iron uptake porin [Nostoc edaphicum CCNP1411]